MNASMTRKSALEHFGLEEGADPERIRDAYESACFEVRQKALMNLGVPRIMKKRFEVLQKAREAYTVLLEEEDPLRVPFSFQSIIPFEEACEHLGSPPPWSNCIREYEKRIGEVQLRVANSFHAPALGEAITDLILEQQAYHAILYEGFAPILLDPEHYPLAYSRINRDIKASQKAYSGSILKDFETLESKGLGKKGIHAASEDMERGFEKGGWEDENAVCRILTEAFRIHKLRGVDEEKKKKP